MATAIIGTAGRDKTKPMTLQLWKWMLRDAYSRIPKGEDLTSGGAAWADHIAVSMMLFGWAGSLTLHLPAPFEEGYFVGPNLGAANAANYYHSLFSQVIDRDTLSQLTQVLQMPNVHVAYEPVMPGYKGMFARNAKVSKVEKMLAYTFGIGDCPADGGTLDTWNKCQGEKTHVSLPYLR